MTVAGATYRPGVDLQIEPIEWAVTYPVNPRDPIGSIRLERGGYRAHLAAEDLGVHFSRDRAVEVIWERFLEHARVEHEVAARTHGSWQRG